MERKELIEAVYKQVLARLQQPQSTPAPESITCPVGVSSRHLHISRDHLDLLFGQGYELQKRNELTQPGEFAAEETVTLVGPKMRPYENVRILGPLRPHTQVEISRTDAYYLGLKAPVRVSGDIKDTPGLTLVGPKGTVVLQEGVIRANRHIHATPEIAQRLDFSDRQLVAVRPVQSANPCILLNVMIRVIEPAFFELHLDTDDANAIEVRTGDEVEILTTLPSSYCNKTTIDAMPPSEEKPHTQPKEQ